MSQGSLQVVPYSRHVSQILRFAVAHVEACEYAEDLAGTLCRERHIGANEGGCVEPGIAGAASAYVTSEQSDFGRLRHIDAGILEQRGKVIGCRTHQGVLEVQNAELLEVSAAGKPKQIRRMIV